MHDTSLFVILRYKCSCECICLLILHICVFTATGAEPMIHEEMKGKYRVSWSDFVMVWSCLGEPSLCPHVQTQRTQRTKDSKPWIKITGHPRLGSWRPVAFHPEDFLCSNWLMGSFKPLNWWSHMWIPDFYSAPTEWSRPWRPLLTVVCRVEGRHRLYSADWRNASSRRGGNTAPSWDHCERTAGWRSQNRARNSPPVSLKWGNLLDGGRNVLKIQERGGPVPLMQVFEVYHDVWDSETSVLTNLFLMFPMCW